MSQCGDGSTCPRSLSPELVDCLQCMEQLATQLEEEKRVVEVQTRAKAEEKVAEECCKGAERETVWLVALTAEQA